MNKIKKLVEKRTKALEREEKARKEAEELKNQINYEVGSAVIDMCVEKSINTDEFFKILNNISNKKTSNEELGISEELKDEKI